MTTTASRAEQTATGRRVFVSYGHDEYAAVAERLVHDLLAAGHEVWFDRDRIRPGDDYLEYITEGLEWTSGRPGTGCFVLLMTPHSVRRPNGFCLKELARAVDRNLKVIPVMVADVEPPVSIANRDYLDLRNAVPVESHAARYARELARLCEAIGRDGPQFDGVQARLRHHLPPIAFHADVEKHLHGFTGRRRLLDDYEEWLGDDRGEPVFWLTASPGAGKTAFSAHLVATRPEILAYHFCLHGDPERVDARRAVQSIAFQLAASLPDYAQRLNALDLDRLAVADPRSAFNALVEAPLSTGFPVPAARVVVLVDALDEATRTGTNDLAALVAAEAHRLPPWLRFFLTSRDTREMQFLLQGFSAHPLEVSADDNRKDLRRYLVDRLARLGLNGAAHARLVDAVMERSESLFLYARWVCDEIDAGRLSPERPDDFPRGLSGIYAQFFARQFADIDVYRQRVRPVMDVLAAAREPLGATELARLFGWSGYETDELLGAMKPLFSAGTGRIRPFHLSVLDWLRDKTRAMQYRVDAEAGNSLLARHVWAEYQAGVAALSPYSLMHLPAHLAAVNEFNDHLRTVLLDFDWIRAKLEAAGIAALRRDYMLRDDDRAVYLVGDALRRGALALQHEPALLAQQLLGRLHASAAPGLKGLLARAAAYDSRIWLRPLSPSLIPSGDPLYASLSGHNGTVRSVAISRDGTRAVSAGNSYPDQTLRLWDLEVGTQLACHEKYAREGYTALCITADSTHALSSLAQEINVWDLRTGDRVHVLRGHDSLVTALAATADRAVSGSANGRVVVWNLRELEPIGEWQDQDEVVWAVAISADGNKAAAAMSDRVVVRDLDTGRSVERRLECGFDGRWSYPPLEFDAGATRLRFGKPLVEWSLAANQLETLGDPSDRGQMLAINDTGAIGLRFIDGDGMHLWDVLRGQRIRRLPGLKAEPAAVDITPDARWAVDTAFTHEVRLWDLRLLQEVPTANEGLRSTHRMSMAPDGAHVVMTHDIRPRRRPAGRTKVTAHGRSSVWDVRTGKRLPEAAAQKVLRRRTPREPAAHAALPVRKKRSGQYAALELVLGSRYIARCREEGWTVRVEDRKTRERVATFDCDAPIVGCMAVGTTLLIGEASGRVHFLRLEGTLAGRRSDRGRSR
jgi:WD40 repeat protein